MLTNFNVPSNFSALATKPLTILLSIGVHYVLASNLGILSLPPLKPKPFGGTVKVVELTPAERTRVPEVVRSRPVPIAPVPTPSPSPVIRIAPDLSRSPATPLANPAPATNKSSSATTTPKSENQPGSDKGSSTRPKKEVPKIKKPSEPTYSVNKKGPTLESMKPDKSTPKPSRTASAKKTESTGEVESSGSDNLGASIKPPPSKPTTSSTPTPPTKPQKPSDGEARNFNKPFDSKIGEMSKVLKLQYPDLQITIVKVSPIIGNRDATAPAGNPNKFQYFKIAYVFLNDEGEYTTIISPERPITELLAPSKTHNLITEAEKIAKKEHIDRIKNNKVKGKISVYVVQFKIES
jgi:hypothetical protein